MLISKRLSKISVGKISSVILEDFLLVCGLRVNINATIIGDTKGHRFEWELITGSSQGIIYMSPLDGLTLDYIFQIPPGIREDKKFRFWIDKGSSRQKFYDIWVWSSFVDNYRSNNSKDLSTNQSNVINQLGPESISAWIGQTNQYYPNLLSSAERLQTLFLIWYEPSSNNSTYLLYYSIERYDLSSNTWVIYKNNAVNFIEVDILPNVNYRVVATYYNPYTSQLSKIYSRVVSYNSIDTRGQNSNAVFNDHLYNGGGALNDANLISNYVNFTNTNLLITELYENVYSAGALNASNLITSYVNFTNTNLINNTESIDSMTNGAALNNNNVVTTYTVFSNVNIGG